jgi:hypothetical protein
VAGERFDIWAHIKGHIGDIGRLQRGRRIAPDVVFITTVPIPVDQVHTEGEHVESRMCTAARVDLGLIGSLDAAVGSA